MYVSLYVFMCTTQCRSLRRPVSDPLEQELEIPEFEPPDVGTRNWT